jgi:hypothetical protein
MPDFDGAVVFEAHDCLGHLAGTVAEAGVLHPETEPDCLAFLSCPVVDVFHRVEASSRPGAAGVHDLAWTPLDTG